MKLDNAVAVVTGGNRGLGREFVTQLLDRGATVYATARRPETIEAPGAIPLRLDVTDQASIAAAAAIATDATLVINNAGISTRTTLMDGDLDALRLELETHLLGSLATTRAFAPILQANGGGSILNVLSVVSWLHMPAAGAYSVAKTAAWAMSNIVRQELAPRDIHVATLHVGFLDTDMAARIAPEHKLDPATVARTALDGIAAGLPEIIIDDLSRQAKANLSAPL